MLGRLLRRRRPDVLLSVPYFRQDTNYSCGPATIQMICAFYGYRESERDLMRLAKTTTTGTSHGNLISATLKFGLYVYLNTDTTLQEIKYFLDSGIPVVVNYTEPSTEDGHYAVAVGYSAKHLILHDPWNGPHFHLPWREFERRWYDHGVHKSHHWLLAVSDKPFAVGRQYAPNQ